MKKILIVNNNMHIGGIQKALLNLLREISGEYEIDLMIFSDKGELYKYIPDNVTILRGNIFTKLMGISQEEARRSGILTYALRSLFALLTRIFTTRVTFGILTRLCHIRKEYDMAVSYMQNNDSRMFYGGCAEFVRHSVKSKNKVCFIHCDFLNYGGNNTYNRHILSGFDKIAAVSESVGRQVNKALPCMSDKTFIVHNCIDYDEIKRLGDEYEAEYSDGLVNLFTAARISEEKGIIRMLPILEKMKDDGFVWRIAGEGPDADRARRLVAECGLEDRVIFLGKLVNPYPYFKKSDIVLVPSYNEAAPMVFGEAEVFGTPVFSTNTLSAAEMINDGSGWICENTDSAIAENLKDVIRDFKKGKNKCRKLDNRRAKAEFDLLMRN